MFFHDPPLPLGVMGRAVSHHFTRPKICIHCSSETCHSPLGPGVGEGPCQQEWGSSNALRGQRPGALPQIKERTGSVLKQIPTLPPGRNFPAKAAPLRYLLGAFPS